jgi:hypothetical protein
VRRTPPSACYGRNRWKALADRRSRRQPSRNASMAVTAAIRQWRMSRMMRALQSASKPTLPLLRAGSGPRNTGLSDTRGLDVLRRKVAFWLQREDAVEREQTKASGVADWK